jgi:hypothetical protein
MYNIWGTLDPAHHPETLMARPPRTSRNGGLGILTFRDPLMEGL